MVQANRCEVCSHIWVSDAILQDARNRFEEPGRVPDEMGLPIRCAKCKSPYWNRDGRWVDPEVQGPAVFGGVKNGDARGSTGEAGNNSEVDERGVGGGITKSDAGAVFAGRVRAVAGGGGGKASRKEARSGEGNKKPAVTGQEEAVAPTRPSGKCPHGYMNWLVCPKCNPKAGK